MKAGDTVAYLPCTMKDWGAKIHDISVTKGFYLGEPKHEDKQALFFFATTKLALAMGEVAEAIEDLRKGNVEHEAEEIADTIIRLLDYAEWRGFNMDMEVAKKVAFNSTRPFMHGKTHG